MLGTLIYNEILVVKYFGLNLYTKAALAKEKEGEDAENAKNAAYMASSPAATYDTSRNKRLLARVAAEEEEEYAKDDANSGFVLNTSESDTKNLLNKSELSASDC